jgi:transposase
MDMPDRYGFYVTAWRRLKGWQEEGAWERMFKALTSARGHGRVAVDSSTVEAKGGGNLLGMTASSTGKARKYTRAWMRTLCPSA